MSGSSPIEIVFHGGSHHTSQILAQPRNVQTKQTLRGGIYQWLRLVGGSYEPIQGATTQCFCPTADDLYTAIQLSFTSAEGLVVKADVPVKFFTMDPKVFAVVDGYVNQGRAEGITFEVTRVPPHNSIKSWYLNIQNGVCYLYEDEDERGIFQPNQAIILSPSHPQHFHLGSFHLGTDSLRSRDVIALTYRALMNQL